jgi:outer membrane lipoprotein-sorting protein
MKNPVLVVSLALLLAASAFGQAKPANLEQVLSLLDKASVGFKSVQTNFVWDQYEAVVPDHDIQKGVMYFHRREDAKRDEANVEMAAEITFPAQKFVLFSGELLQVYLPKVDEVTRYTAGKNRADFEAYLTLGFGGRGHDLLKSFDVTYAGMENLGGKPTCKLELVPKSQKVKNMFNLITLWIDPQTGMSVQQKFKEGGGDYRLATYTSIQINRPLPHDAFRLKTTNRTKYVSPN